MKFNFTVNIIFFFFYLIFHPLHANNIGAKRINKSDNCKPPYGIKIEKTGLDSTYISWRHRDENVSFVLAWREKDSIYNDSNISPVLDESFYILKNLKSGTVYYFKIKTVCGEEESRWSNEYNFTTHIANPSGCALNLPVKDYYNKPAKTYFYIENTKDKDKKLGVDVFIKSVNVIISHSWTSDLQLNLISPSGKKVVLSKYVGNNDTTGYGNIQDSACVSVVSFSDEACESIDDNNFPFTGSYRPHGKISSIYDSISPGGIWTLEVIDRSPGYSGKLQYIDIEFEPLICPVVKDVSLKPVDDASVLITWTTEPLIDSLIINAEDTIIVNAASGEYLFEGLSPASTTEFSFVSKCTNRLSQISCPYRVQTLCSSPSLREDFDSYNPDCNADDCLQSDIWFNYNPAAKWLLNNGPTSTENTGPASGVYGSGNYLYIESSTNSGEDTVFILQSQCLDVNYNFNNCNMSFYYHMYGIDIQSLSFLCSSDGGEHWDTLFYKYGSQGDMWHKAEIRLLPYLGFSCIFRFVATTAKDKNLGDIAIDDIIFYNVKPAQEEKHYFYPDRDKDGYGKDTVAQIFCIKPPGFVDNNNDCDDSNPDIHPGATEIECNFIDENCNGMADDISGDNPLKVTLVSIKNATCNALNDGVIVIKAENGIPPYSFLWSNGSRDSILTHVPAGKYWCKVTDSLGCGVITDTFEVNHDNPITITVTDMQQPACNGIADGSIDIECTGGEPPLAFFWSNGDTTKNLQDVQAGIYTVTVTDARGCTSVSGEIELKAKTTFYIGEILKLDPSCHDKNNGKIYITVDGGEIPYSYLWSTGDTTPAVTGLAAGDYYCTITDNRLCYQVYGPVHLERPSPLSVTISALDHVRCIGEENGLIELKTSGGTPPYSYLWKNNESGFVSFKDDIYGLEPGIYTVTVSDRHGCHKTLDSIRIKTQDSITVLVDSLQHVRCPGSKNGYIKIKAGKGYGGYHYVWSNGIKNKDYIDSLPKGIYGVTTTDDLGCRYLLNNIEIKNLNFPLDIGIFVHDSIKCYGDSTGIVIATVNSTAPPFDFNWSAGHKNISFHYVDTLAGLGAGEYNVTVTDNEGCTGTSPVVSLTQPEELVIANTEVEDILCYGDSTGTIRLEVEGGVPPYQAIWNGGRYTGLSLARLGAGTYKATIQDKNHCTKPTGEIELTQPGEIKVKVETKAAHRGAADGYARISVEGGVSPYRFEWDENAGNQTSNEAFNLKSGWYNVSLTDYNECFKLVKVFVPQITKTVETGDEKVNIFPNPASQSFVLSGDIISPDCTVELFDMKGSKKRIEISFAQENKIKVILKEKLAGIFILKVTNNRMCYYKRIVILNP